MARVYLSLGTNLGDRTKNLRLALLKISQLPKSRMIRSSSVYETEPVLPPSFPRQNYYFNLVTEIETRLPPKILLDHLLEIEKKLGRTRREQYEPRIIDIDILFYERRIISQENLTIPHPRLNERRFVLEPLNELNPEFLDPESRKTVAELLGSAPRDQEVKKASCGELIKPDPEEK